MSIELIKHKMITCQTFASSLAGARVYFREDWGTLYFELFNKQFGLMKPEATEESFITLKNKPDINLELRDSYPNIIIPGYYTNKKHWNSIKLKPDEVTSDFLNQLIKTSYDLVFEKLTKKEKTFILNQRN
ncbi:MmcQ/YjbR family DNA-binding protein [Vagococcus sp.]|uniref:MmcQ/YjbR family DNA-binding protein n=1 Tax=Vagococcus sp. TaxID=1933889 RepID=UPI003F96DA7F